MTLMVLGSPAQDFCRLSPNWDLSEVFPQNQAGVVGFGRKITQWSAILNILLRLRTSNITYHCWCWPQSPEVLFVQFLHWKVTPTPSPPPLFHTALFGGSLWAQTTLREWGLCFPPLGCNSYIIYLQLFCIGDLPLLSQLLFIILFSHWFILVWTLGCLLYTWGYNALILLLVLATGSPSLLKLWSKEEPSFLMSILTRERSRGGTALQTTLSCLLRWSQCSRVANAPPHTSQPAGLEPSL